MRRNWPVPTWLVRTEPRRGAESGQGSDPGSEPAPCLTQARWRGSACSLPLAHGGSRELAIRRHAPTWVPQPIRASRVSQGLPAKERDDAGQPGLAANCALLAGPRRGLHAPDSTSPQQVRGNPLIPGSAFGQLSTADLLLTATRFRYPNAGTHGITFESFT
jgi:hypothetical protein